MQYISVVLSNWIPLVLFMDEPRSWWWFLTGLSLLSVIPRQPLIGGHSFEVEENVHQDELSCEENEDASINSKNCKDDKSDVIVGNQAVVQRSVDESLKDQVDEVVEVVSEVSVDEDDEGLIILATNTVV